MQEVRFKAFERAERALQEGRLPLPIRPPIERIGLPERDVLRRKIERTLEKPYDTKGSPVELLLYFHADAEKPLTAGCLPPIGDVAEHVKHVMLPILQNSAGQFRRVWVYERYRPSILWSWPGWCKKRNRPEDC